MKNQVTLIGKMGSDAQVTQFENGSKVARFSLAINSSDKKAEWHKLFAWGNLAQFIENFGAKGKQIAISGKLVQRTFINQQGLKQNITEVEVRQVIGLS